MNKIREAWEARSKKYGIRLEGVLPKSFPKVSNKYLDVWMWRQVKKQILSRRKQKILDLGCGYGRLAKKILTTFPQADVFGVDISKTYVDLFNKNLSPNGRAKVADIKYLPFKDSTFDICYMVTTLMYLVSKSEQQQAISEIFRVLKPGGRFVFIERNKVIYFLMTLGGLLGREINSTSFSRREIEKLVGGGNILKTSGIPFWTLTLPYSFLTKKLFWKVEFLDRVFNWLLTLSMYIAYIGEKR